MKDLHDCAKNHCKKNNGNSCAFVNAVKNESCSGAGRKIEITITPLRKNWEISYSLVTNYPETLKQTEVIF